MSELLTTERLASALYDAGAPPWMITNAKAGWYDDYKSELADPINQLVADARRVGLHGIAERAIDGEFDSTAEEARAWAKSPDGQATFNEFMGGAS